MTSMEQHANGKDETLGNNAKKTEQPLNNPREKELTEQELEAVSGGGVTNTGTGGSNLGSGAGRT